MTELFLDFKTVARTLDGLSQIYLKEIFFMVAMVSSE
jgi:hypothetical protein